MKDTEIAIAPGEIDDWIDSRNYVTPPGGEIVVDSGETFDYPVEPASSGRMDALHRALDVVLESHRADAGVREAFQDALDDAVEGASDEVDIGALIMNLTLPRAEEV
jgi:hypothetical protein